MTYADQLRNEIKQLEGMKSSAFLEIEDRLYYVWKKLKEEERRLLPSWKNLNKEKHVIPAHKKAQGQL